MRTIAYETVPCLNCGCSDHTIFAVGKELASYRFYAAFEGFDRLNYVSCKACGLIYANPRIAYTDSTLTDLFPDHVERRPQERRRRARESKSCRIANLIALRNGALGRFLDVGCGFGDAMRVAIEAGFEAVGTEVHGEFVARCRADGLEVRPGRVDRLDFDDQSFDVIFLDDVLEHLKDPFRYLDDAARLLRPGGILFIHTWTIGAPTTVVAGFGPDWRDDYNLDLTAHTVIFPRPLLRQEIETRGLDILRADPESRPAADAVPDGKHHIQFWDFYARR